MRHHLAGLLVFQIICSILIFIINTRYNIQAVVISVYLEGKFKKKSQPKLYLTVVFLIVALTEALTFCISGKGRINYLYISLVKLPNSLDQADFQSTDWRFIQVFLHLYLNKRCYLTKKQHFIVTSTDQEKK